MIINIAYNYLYLHLYVRYLIKFLISLSLLVLLIIIYIYFQIDLLSDYKAKYLKKNDYLILTIHADEIITKTGNENVIVMKLDTADLQSVRDFAEEFKQKEKSLHILVCALRSCPIFKE